MNLVDIFVGISEVWLKRRFQNDALGRTRLGGKGKAGKSRGKAAKKKDKKVPKLDVDKMAQSSETPDRPQTARTSAELHESIAGIASEFPGMWRR